MAELTYQYGDQTIARGLLDIAKFDFEVGARDSVENVVIERDPDGSATFSVTIKTHSMPKDVVDQVLARAQLS